ncbi:MAG TPA: SAM-dependent chlorinase/fluorinase [Thermoanaerobaculia bacterium]|nr:SAM-dependent chlorinase/fluorinase [Thermoanaerobaculia bacterium]
MGAEENRGLLTFTTDFGLSDYYVAAVKGTVMRLAPGAQMVDVSHQIPPGDLAAGAFVWAAAVPWFPPGTVHLAVVDPGVGSERRILVARTEDAWLVCPDNGLLTHLLDRGLPILSSAVREVRAVEKSDLFLRNPGQTFHGRDRFAPVAAWLLRGGPAEELGPVVHEPRRLPFQPARREPGRLTGEVIHVDTYGNAVTNVPSAWLPRPWPQVVSEVGEVGEVGGHGGRTVRHLATHYQEIPPGEAALLPGSVGTLEISLNGSDLARQWNIQRGSGIVIESTALREGRLG